MRWAVLLTIAAPLLAAPYEKGAVHPDFRLPRVDGSGFGRLADYRGRRVVLFHFASW